jgi:hypothetical protein
MQTRAHPFGRQLALGAALCIAASAQAAGHAHEHGVVKLDIAIDAGTVTVQMQTPLDNLIGFERAPRNDAERKKADAAVARLKAADSLFRIDPAAGCTLGKVELVSAPLKLGASEPGAADDGHADLDADFTFTCRNAAGAAFIDLALFNAFAGMQRIEVQIAAPQGQFKRTLQRPASRITLGR